MDINLIHFLHIQWERNCIILLNCRCSTSYLLTHYQVSGCPLSGWQVSHSSNDSNFISLILGQYHLWKSSGLVSCKLCTG